MRQVYSVILLEMMSLDSHIFLNLFLQDFTPLTTDKVFNVRFISAKGIANLFKDYQFAQLSLTPVDHRSRSNTEVSMVSFLSETSEEGSVKEEAKLNVQSNLGGLLANPKFREILEKFAVDESNEIRYEME